MPGCPALPDPLALAVCCEFFGLNFGLLFGMGVKHVYERLKSSKLRKFLGTLIFSAVVALYSVNTYQSIFEYFPLVRLIRLFSATGLLIGFFIGWLYDKTNKR
ncbi:MAG: hypothetical protein QXO67_02240 [Candidatus Bathyarchaeia archaeon]